MTRLTATTLAAAVWVGLFVAMVAAVATGVGL